MKTYTNGSCPQCGGDSYEDEDFYSGSLIYKCDNCDLEMDKEEFPDSHK